MNILKLFKMKKILYALMITGLVACGEEKGKPTLDELLKNGDKTGGKDKPITKEVEKTEEIALTDAEQKQYDSLVQALPVPLEIQFLIKDIGSHYDNTYLNPLENLENYSTDLQKAVNIGIYGADLGYTNLYDVQEDGLNYLGGVRSLAKDLNIDKFFEGDVITDLIKNSNNLDSLLVLTTSNFEKINVNLQENKRTHLGVLLLVGGWIEGLNLACEVSEHYPNKELKDRIGEQKEGLKVILQLLKFFEEHEYFKSLVQDLKGLSQEFEKVKIDVKSGGTEEVDMGGWFMTVDKSVTIITYSEEDLKSIAAKVASIRKKLID